MFNPDEAVLLAISIKSLQNEPYMTANGLAKSAVIRGVSEEKDACFTFQTCLLNPEQLRRCELLQQHGFTVVELPKNWRYGFSNPGGWQEVMIQRAMEQIAERYENTEGIVQVEKFDPEFAREVLAKVNEHFPTAIQLDRLKHSFDIEPSDKKLLVALDGLLCDGFIDGLPLYEQAPGQRELAMMANIKMTATGRRHLSPVQSHSRIDAPTIIHGDQYNVAQAAAVGPHSTGTFNNQPHWAGIQSVDLEALRVELERLRQHLGQSASTGADYAQLQIIAEAKAAAENRDKSKLLEFLAKGGKVLLDSATDFGAKVTAEVIAKQMGLS